MRGVGVEDILLVCRLADDGTDAAYLSVPTLHGIHLIDLFVSGFP